MTPAALIADLLALPRPGESASAIEISRFDALVNFYSVAIGATHTAERLAFDRERAAREDEKLAAHRQRYLDRLKDLADAAASVPESPSSPEEMTDAEAAWYLAEMDSEFIEYNWPRTLQGAREHYRTWGKPEGRRKSPTSPGWGPRWNSPDRPPHLTK